MKVDMHALIGQVHDRIALKQDHCFICNAIATEFGLWVKKKDGPFPIWLSRVVEGVIRDVEDGIFDV